MRMIKGLLVAMLAACGGSSSNTGTETPPVTENPPTEEVTETPTEETPKPPEETPVPPPKKLTLEERIAYHAGCFKQFQAEDPAFVDKCYTDSSSEEQVDFGMPPAVGKKAIAASTKEFWDAFKIEGETVLTLGNGDNVINVMLLTGTHDGPFLGLAPTGKTFGLLGAEIQNLDDQGRHGNVRVYFDAGTLMGHLGQLPKGAKFRAVMAKKGSEPAAIIATDSDVEKQNLELVKSGFEVFNKHDAKGLAAKYAKDAVFSQQAMPVDAKGTKAITTLFTDLFKAFPDIVQQTDGIWAAGDYVVVETTITGTNKGPFKPMGLTKATGKPVKLRELHVFKIEGGLAKEHWAFVNGMAFAMQLGLIPPPAAPKNP